MKITQLSAFNDNYIYLLEANGKIAVVDPGDPTPVINALGNRKLDYIFTTHHHRDHIGGNLLLKDKYGCHIFGEEKDSRIPGIDTKLSGGDEFYFGQELVKVFSADGHTRGHIAYWMPESKALFSGDVIFSLGCGKLFEGSPQEMWATLSVLRELPADTMIYGAHEYTLDNAKFAQIVEPENKALAARIHEAQALRAKGLPTVPTSMELERNTNPFLRPESAAIQKNTNSIGCEKWQIFAAVREAKDRFDG